jgi:hypothetical protein
MIATKFQRLPIGFPGQELQLYYYDHCQMQPEVRKNGRSRTGSAHISACTYDSGKIPTVKPIVVAKSLLGSVDSFDYKFVIFDGIFRQ